MTRDFVGTYLDAIRPAPSSRCTGSARGSPRRQYEQPPQLLAVRTNTVPAMQARDRAAARCSAAATAAATRRSTLANTPVLAGSLQLADRRRRPARKTGRRCRRLLRRRGPDDLHLVLNRTQRRGPLRRRRATARSRSPTPTTRTPTSSRVEYRFGGGTRGNVPAGAIKNLLTPVDGHRRRQGRPTCSRPSAAATRRRSTKPSSARRARLRARGRAVTRRRLRDARQAGRQHRAREGAAAVPSRISRRRGARRGDASSSCRTPTLADSRRRGRTAAHRLRLSRPAAAADHRALRAAPTLPARS